MLKALKNMLNIKEENSLPSDTVHLYFNLERSISIKVQINENTSCLDLFNRYSTEILSVLTKKMNENIEKYLNLEEHFGFMIINTNCKMTQMKLKGYHNPWRYLEGTMSRSILPKSTCNLYFLITQPQELNTTLAPAFKAVTRESILESHITSTSQVSQKAESKPVCPEAIKFSKSNKKIKKNKLNKIEGFNLNNIRRDGALKELCFSKWKYIKKHVYIDPERLFIYDESSEEVNVIMFTEVISIKKYDNKYKLEEAINKIFKFEDIPAKFEYKEFSIEVKTEYNDIIILKSSNEYDLTNWVESLVQAFTSIRDIKVMKCLDQMLSSVNIKIYQKEITLLTQSFSKRGIFSFYFQMELPHSMNRLYQWVAFQFSKAVEEMEVPNSPVSSMSFEQRSKSFQHHHLNMLKIFLVQGFPLLKKIYQYKDYIKTFHMNEAYQTLLKISDILPSIKETGKNGFSIQSLINNANKESELILSDSFDMGFKLSASSTMIENKSDLKWKRSCNCDDLDEHNGLKPINEEREVDNQNNNPQSKLNLHCIQSKRSIIISRKSEDGEYFSLPKSCAHNALTKSSSHDRIKKKSSVIRSENESNNQNQAKFKEEYYKCYVKELFSNLKSLEEELTIISSNHNYNMEYPNKLKSARQTALYSRLKFETIDWLSDFIVEELPSYSAFTYFFRDCQLYQNLSHFLLVYLQNETFFGSKSPEQALIDAARLQLCSFK